MTFGRSRRMGRGDQAVVPPLTYVNVPALEMGRTAIELLAGEGPARLLPAVLVAGGTVAPPPKT